MSTTTSFWTRSGRWEAKYIALRPPIESPTRTHEVRPSWSTTPEMSSKAAAAV